MLVVAAILSIFSDNRMLDNVADYMDFLRRWGLWQWAAVACTVISARRLSRWVRGYSTTDLTATLDAQDGKPAEASAGPVSFSGS
jgi:hypothetical protein